MDANNGILAQVPGDCVGAGSTELPPAGPDQASQPERQVELHVPGVGFVRLTYRLNSYRHGKSRYWHWVAEHAQLARV